MWKDVDKELPEFDEDVLMAVRKTIITPPGKDSKIGPEKVVIGWYDFLDHKGAHFFDLSDNGYSVEKDLDKSKRCGVLYWAKLPEIDSSEWVNVEEKLPGFEEDIIMQIKRLKVGKDGICAGRLYRITKKGSIFTDLTRNDTKHSGHLFYPPSYIDEVYSYKITHWMPVPEMPKGIAVNNV